MSLKQLDVKVDYKDVNAKRYTTKTKTYKIDESGINEVI